MSIHDVSITRQNVITIIKGTKRHLYDVNEIKRNEY